jgi:tetratricopeptide (TPR) repeat protein
MSRKIENLLRKEKWMEARRLIKTELRSQPADHWLLARLALTYYEQFDYGRALAIGQRAYKLAPHCPLVLWDLAGTFDMLERYREAGVIFRRIIQRGVQSIAFDDCGEGLGWARGLVADCWYRLARLHGKRGRRRDAVRCYQQHLAMRGPGCRSIYPLQKVRGELHDYESNREREKAKSNWSVIAKTSPDRQEQASKRGTVVFLRKVPNFLSL